MQRSDVKRLETVERRSREIAEEFGLSTTDVMFEIVSSQQMLEGMAYRFPTNFSHWTFGRDYERQRTIYEHTGGGLPYEVVWNFEVPRAFLMESNPFALNALVIAHVWGHVDFFLESRYLQRGRAFSDIAGEARSAAERFRGYEERYGKENMEKFIDAAMSIEWHQHPDPFFEEPDEEEMRERLIQRERAMLERTRDIHSQFKKPETKAEIREIEKRLKRLSRKTPPGPVYDLLWYITRKSPLPLEPWQQDVLSVVRSQARALSPNRKTKMLNEGWATYWHVRIMRRLFEEGILDAKEHGIFSDFHAKVTRPLRRDFNWYAIGPALYEYVRERWDRGQFGLEFEECGDSAKRAYWDTKVGKGREKIFELRSFYTDRMAIEHFFDADFIRRNDLYLYTETVDPQNGDIVDVIAEKDPETIRRMLKHAFVHYGTPVIRVEDGNHNQRSELYLVHEFDGFELDPAYRDRTLENIHELWGRAVHLETVIQGKRTLCTYNGRSVSTDTGSSADGLMEL
ncbi:MAG: SpoVR family protein [Candidatus Niyogibacteria bacterium]|nr:SpoVR family protein [Candidatus Niyogibacteria bacterium]